MTHAARSRYDDAAAVYGDDSPWLSLIRRGLANTSKGDPVEAPEEFPGIDFASLWAARFGAPPLERIVARL